MPGLVRNLGKFNDVGSTPVKIRYRRNGWNYLGMFSDVRPI